MLLRLFLSFHGGDDDDVDATMLFERYAEIPDTPRNCELHNDTVLEVVCSAGSDGGLMQSFLLEVVGGVAPPAYNLDYTRGPPTEFDNEISTMNDQVMAFVCTFASPAALHRCTACARAV